MSKNKIKVLDRHFKNKLDRKQSNKKERQISKTVLVFEGEEFELKTAEEWKKSPPLNH